MPDFLVPQALAIALNQERGQVTIFHRTLTTKLSNAAALIVFGIPAAWPAHAQEAQATPAQIAVGGMKITGIPNDWSFRHLVFSNPGTEDEAIRNGRHAEWLRIVNEPRFVMEQLHRHAAAQGPAAAQVAALEAQTAAAEDPGKKPRRKIHKDWSEGLGSPPSHGLANLYPAKWSFSATTASCANDFVVYPTTVTGSATEATVMAYNNLYSGCGGDGAVPSVYWAYNTGGQIYLSPVMSGDGSQMAFIQFNGASVATLVLVKWAASSAQSLSNPGTPTTVSASSYPSCTAPCMTSVGMTGTANTTLYSSPFYDYGSDSMFAADDFGNLHKFQPVFNGVPAEVTSSGWPVALHMESITSSPVYDPISGCVFVGNWNGNLYSVNSGNPGASCTSTTGSVRASSAAYAIGNCRGIQDGPLVDSTAASVYAFSQDYLEGATYNDVVAQFSTGFAGTGANAAHLVNIGIGDRQGNFCFNYGIWSGAFDNVYYSSATPTSPSGHLYVTGNSYGPATLYQLTITNNALTATFAGPQLEATGGGTGNAAASPITEFCNNGMSACVSDGTNTTAGADYIFLSADDGAPAGCTGDCVMSFTVNTPSAFSSGTTPNAPLSIPTAFEWPTGGFIIDNSVGSGTLVGASQIYFLTLADTTCGNGVGGVCATQASQSAP